MLRQNLKMFIVGLTLTLLLMVIRLVAPQITGMVVDDVILGGMLDVLPKLLWLMGGLTLGSGLTIYLRGLLFEKISMEVVYRIRTNLFEHLHELPYRFYDKHRIGEIMSRMTGDIEAIRNFIAGGIVTIIEQSLYFLGSMIMILTISPVLAGILLLITPFLAVVCYKFRKAIRSRFDAIRDQSAVLNARTQENISGIRVVKAYAREAYEKERFAVENNKHRNLGIDISVTWAKYHPIVEFIASIIPGVMLLVGGYLAVRGTISAGEVVKVFGYLWMISDPMRQVANILNMLTQTSSSGERLFYYADIGSEIREVENPQYPEEFKGHVVFDHVNFTYGDEMVLNDINIDVPAGNTVAIMGATGSGKSSVVNLLGRFYECQSGAVTIDGIDVKQYPIKELRRNLGYVMQETFLFSDSLRENIAFGRPNATQEEIDQAAEIAQATEYISEMDLGYDTIVGERGMGLSGGQKQRAAIARAIVLNPKILILDDATSAVDLETESAIQQGLKKVLKDRTTFIISHRISAVKDADEIIVLDAGHIAERGTHETLMKLKGLYYGIFMDQYRDYQSVLGVKEVG